MTCPPYGTPSRMTYILISHRLKATLAESSQQSLKQPKIQVCTYHQCGLHPNLYRKADSQTTNPDEEVRNALRTLTGTLQHRRRLLVRAVENVIEDFRSSLHSTHTDAFSPIRTSIVGKLMEGSYHAANMEYGTHVPSHRYC